MIKAVLIFGLLAGVSSLRLNDAERPIAKVLNMLKDMQAQLEKEADEDAEAYETMQCWCETGSKEKAKAISDAEAHIKDLEATIEEMAAKSQQSQTDVEALKAQVSEQSAALEQATG